MNKVNKADAAQFLGVSPRTLERYTSSGRITAVMFRGALDYLPSSLIVS